MKHEEQYLNAKKMCEILYKYYFYYDVDDLLFFCDNPFNCLELTRKAYGDSYEKDLEEVFDREDYQQLVKLARELNINLPETVWYN